MRVIHRGGQRVLLVRPVHPDGADGAVSSVTSTMLGHVRQAAPGRAALGDRVARLRSRWSPARRHCTAMFSAKKRASAMRSARRRRHCSADRGQRFLAPARSRRRRCRTAADRAWRRRAPRRGDLSSCAEQPSRSRGRGVDRVVEPRAGRAEGRIVGGLHRRDDVAQLVEIGLHRRAARSAAACA